MHPGKGVLSPLYPLGLNSRKSLEYFPFSVSSAHVYCTDLPTVVPLIELNRDINQHMITGSFTAVPLKW